MASSDPDNLQDFLIQCGYARAQTELKSFDGQSWGQSTQETQERGKLHSSPFSRIVVVVENTAYSSPT
jgi:hypothetical protein